MSFIWRFFKKQPVAETRIMCPICLDNMLDPLTTKCNHIFCYSCLSVWLNKNNTCPICRTILRSMIETDTRPTLLETVIHEEPIIVNQKYRVISKYILLTFIGTLIEIGNINNIIRYTFNNIEQSTYPIAETVYVYDNLVNIYSFQ